MHTSYACKVNQIIDFKLDIKFDFGALMGRKKLLHFLYAFSK
jgi:hypothetical protein